MSETTTTEYGYLKSITFPTAEGPKKYLLPDSGANSYTWAGTSTTGQDCVIITNPIGGTFYFTCCLNKGGANGSFEYFSFGINYAGNEIYNLLYASNNNKVEMNYIYGKTKSEMEVYRIPCICFTFKSLDSDYSLNTISATYYGADVGKISYNNTSSIDSINTITLTEALVPQNPYSYIAVGTEPPTESTVGTGATIYL